MTAQELARERRTETIRRNRAMATVIKIVAAKFSTTPEKLLAPGREEPRVTWRQIAMALSYTSTECNLREVRDAFRQRSHKGVIYAVEAIHDKALTDSALAVAIKAVETEVLRAFNPKGGE